ncbi:MAG TPA: hypothetical protein VF275_05455 [Gammaproteobacteria bacterium]
MTQPTLDDIKRSIGHDASCDVSNAISAECSCTRREKIALLERLQEPKKCEYCDPRFPGKRRSLGGELWKCGECDGTGKAAEEAK